MNDREEITLQVISGNGEDPAFLRVSNIRKGSQYPGGRYASASFSLSRGSLLVEGNEIVLWHGGNQCYHGWVDAIEEVRSRASGSLERVTCIGAWGKHMQRRGVDKRWADTAIDAATWEVDTTANGAELATDDRKERIRITPKGVAWANADLYGIAYTMPTGETIGRTEMAYSLVEGVQAWEIRLRDTVGAADIWSVTATGTGTQNTTLGTPRQTLQFQFVSRAAQTPTEGGAYLGEISAVIMFGSREHASATLGNVNAYEIALDIVDLLTGVVSADIDLLDSSLTVALKPFTTNGYEYYGPILARAAGFGNSAFGSIGYGFLPPFFASDNLPKLFLETYPVLTDYDFETSLDEADVNLITNMDDVWNWIIVEYRDLLGNSLRVTPDDDANLTDATSVTAYGQREKVLSVQLSDSADAILYGRRYLARHKDPTYKVSSPVRAARLRAKNGGFVPAALIDAGKRLRITDLPNKIGQASPVGLTFLITATDYDHNSGVASLSLGGTPDDLGIIMAQLLAGIGV